MSKWVNPNTFLVAMLTAIGTLMIVTNVYFHAPDLPTFLLGKDQSLIGQITLLVVIGGLWYTARTFRQSQYLARTNQYEKAAELLANDKVSANVSGMYIMVAAARKYPRMFWEVATIAVSAYLTEAESARYAIYDAFHRAAAKDKKNPPPEVAPMPKWGQSGTGILRALQTLHNLRADERESGLKITYSGNNRIEIDGFPIEHARLRRHEFDRFDMSNVIIGVAYFDDCRLDDSTIHMIVAGKLELTRCNLARAKLSLYDLYGRKLGDPAFDGLVVITDCQTEDATVWDQPVANGRFGREPT